MNLTKPLPRDNQDLFLIVLGGLTPAEIKFIRDKEAQLKNRQVFSLLFLIKKNKQ